MALLQRLLQSLPELAQQGAVVEALQTLGKPKVVFEFRSTLIRDYIEQHRGAARTIDEKWQDAKKWHPDLSKPSNSSGL